MADDLKEIRVPTRQRDELINITARVQEIVDGSGVSHGVCHLFVPHTTAAVTINEGADPAVATDILAGLDQLIPHTNGYRHAEGNSAAHIKTSLMGSSQTILIRGGRLVLGTWQAIFFCEFDGPRTRKVLLDLSGS